MRDKKQNAVNQGNATSRKSLRSRQKSIETHKQ